MTQGNDNSPREIPFAQACWNYRSSSSTILTMEATSPPGNCQKKANGKIAGVKTADAVPSIDCIDLLGSKTADTWKPL